MRITINGQLSLMMLYEMIMERIPDAIPIMHNTDGLETKIPREYVDLYLSICKEWEDLTNLQLEHDEYQKLAIAGCNNYIGLNNYTEVDLKTWRSVKAKNPHYKFKVEGSKFFFAPAKMKGRFDFFGLALHKNKSKLIIPKAIYHYFIHDKMPQDYLSENKNILDYCIGGKSKGDWKQVAKYIEGSELKSDDLQKINRYYISKSGVKITKVNKTDGREIQLEAGRWLQTVYNKMSIEPKWENYDINKTYYLEAIEKEIDSITNVNSSQLTLF